MVARSFYWRARKIFSCFYFAPSAQNASAKIARCQSLFVSFCNSLFLLRALFYKGNAMKRSAKNSSQMTNQSLTLILKFN
jgi:hypothetical protein